MGSKRILSFCFLGIASCLSNDCYGRKVLGHFNELTIGAEYEASASMAAAERVSTKICDKTFLNAFQVGIHKAKTDVLVEALREEMKKDPKIVAFNDVHFEHRSGCWQIEYTPERKKK
ncbi:hypothetical protein EHO61_00660 [Leptospira fluminis]|uniref:Lipoprotein n=1 Tax=Leptospira fluminis TaxID=2484979 RepID=A0A4R9GUN2_9LEPT|nr:hypothetical protein [Leptospira fluminis]TGK22325.1 hypothetical protein EHO61_00660 [Leptospira fluminis]